MKGRLEHELKTKEKIMAVLKDMPEYVNAYYYALQISKEPSTLYNYLIHIRKFLAFIASEGILFENVDEEVIGRYFESIKYRTTNTGIKKSSYAYQKSIWTVLNQFFAFCVKKGYMKNNPLEMTSRPPQNDVVKRKFLSIDDFNKILHTITFDKNSEYVWIRRNRLIFVLLMTTGMRKTALTEINLEDIDYEERTITVIDKRSKIQVYNITTEIENALKDWMALRYQALDGKESDALLISNKGTRMQPPAVDKVVKKYSKMALGYEISPHKLRASFISIYYDATNGDIKATQEAVGHANVATTSIYLSKRNNARKDAMDYISKKLH